MLHGVQRNANERGVGDSKDVARLEIRRPKEGMTCRPEAAKCSSTEGKLDWGSISTR